MTAAQRPRPRPSATADRAAPTRLVGWLADGTPHYAPVGRLLEDGDRVCCHLCGHWFLSVASHLRAHGWSKAAYVDAFGLELGNPLAGAATHKRRAAALTARGVTEPAIRRAQQQARERARTGELTAHAKTANTGRSHSTERLPKTRAALAAIDPRARSAGTARRVRSQLATRAATAAAAFGFDDFAAYAANRVAAGHSLAAMSREAGLHKDWVSRHLAELAPSVRRDSAPDRNDQRWQAILDRLGFADLNAYLHTRHVEQHWTVAAIAGESGRSRSVVQSAMRRHGVSPVAHVGKRHAADHRDTTVAHRLGFASLAEYVAERRAAGATWAALSVESGLPPTTLRRR